jgi:very-short-patch-repair endonuclease
MSSYENHVVKLLNKEKIKYQREKTFSDLKGGKYRFDFYLPNYNGQVIIIEADGEQHFKPIYGRQSFLKGQEHDRQKNSYCLANNIKLYRVPYWEIKNLTAATDIFNPNFLVTTRWHSDLLQVPH